MRTSVENRGLTKPSTNINSHNILSGQGAVYK